MNRSDSHPGSIYTWFVVITLSATMAFSLVDRFALSLLFEPIKQDLSLTDTQLGMLHGVAFGLFYATMGIPLAWLIDRWSRKWVIFLGIACWSVMTALCGLSRNFLQLLGARIGVGVGEATLAPAGYSLIADIIPENKLATAISIFQMGSLFGGGLAFIAGGWILEAVGGADISQSVFFSGLAPWQITFIILALPGVLFLALFLFIREPQRKTLKSADMARPEQTRGLIEALRDKRILYSTLFIGNACLIAISYANLTWLPSILVRQYDWSLPDIGYRFGLLMLFVAPAGVLLGGLLADGLETRGHEDAYPKVLVNVAVLTAILVFFAFFVTSEWHLFILIGVIQFSVSMVIGIGPATVVKIAPVIVRARVSAVYVFAINIIGLGAGPIIIGLFSDYIFTEASGIHTSLLIFNLAMCASSLVLLRMFEKKFRAGIRQRDDYT